MSEGFYHVPETNRQRTAYVSVRLRIPFAMKEKI